MAAHRYWRVGGLEAYGTGDLELSCFHLLAAGVRVDDTATLTSNSAPSTGTLAALQDDDLTTAARWSAASVPSIALQWDSGAGGVDVDDIRIAGNSERRFPLICKLQWSGDAVEWTDYRIFAGITWPGAATKTTSAQLSLDNAVSVLRMAGTDGSTVFIDDCGPLWTAHGAAKISTAQSKGEGSSAYFTGAEGTYISTPSSSDFDIGGGLFTLEFWLFLINATAGTTVVGRKLDSSAYSTVQWDLGVSTGNALNFNVSNGGGWLNPMGSGIPLELNQWNHVALVRESALSSGLKMYVNGKTYLTSTSNPNLETNSASRQLVIGSSPGIGGINSWLEGFRLEKGVARYTGDFTPEVFSQGVMRNQVRGGVAPVRVPTTLGRGPVIPYGIPKVSPPVYLGIESGSVKDLQTGVLGQGIGRVRGTVKFKNTPVNTPLKRRVRLIREYDGLQVRETWSDPVTGIYDFTYIDELQTWTVVSYDYAHDKRAVIADNLTLANGGVELMT